MKFVNTAILMIGAVSLASAGQIEIGGGSNGTISTLGLTAAYVGSTTWTQRNYMTNFFTSDTITNSSLTGVAKTTAAGTGGASTLPTAENGFQQFTDPNNGVTFAMMNDGGSGANINQYWASVNPGTPTSSSITIPIGLFGLTSANILLNDYWGVTGAQNTVVSFNYVSAGTVNVNLINGNQIDASHNCSAAGNSATNCTTFSGTTTSASSDAAWGGNYSEINAATPYSLTSGTVNLNDIAFNLSGHQGDTLTSITITDNASQANVTRLALSAITVTSAPEPSTMFLIAAGLGLVGFAGRRKKATL